MLYFSYIYIHFFYIMYLPMNKSNIGIKNTFRISWKLFLKVVVYKDKSKHQVILEMMFLINLKRLLTRGEDLFQNMIIMVVKEYIKETRH